MSITELILQCLRSSVGHLRWDHFSFNIAILFDLIRTVRLRNVSVALFFGKGKDDSPLAKCKVPFPSYTLENH